MAETPLRQFRLEEELVQRLDRYAAYLDKENPGFKINRTSTLRHILIKHLEKFESQTGVKATDVNVKIGKIAVSE